MNRRLLLAVPTTLMLFAAIGQNCAAGEIRSQEHNAYARRLWDYLHGANSYRAWERAARPLHWSFGPPSSVSSVNYVNRVAAADLAAPAYGSVVVTEHYAAEGGELLAVTVRQRVKQGYDPATEDWYWVHYLPGGELVKSSVDHDPFAKRGFVTVAQDGRLWVFRSAEASMLEFFATGEPAKHVTVPGAGPQGMTLKGTDRDTLLAYVAVKPAFETFVEDGRLWVFRAGSDELASYREAGDLAKHVIRPHGGPLGATIKAPDNETIDEYLTSKPGFVTRVVDGRLWVFRDGSGELAEFEQSGEPAKHVIRPGAGPGGMTLKAPDVEAITEYLTACEGFTTVVQDDRLWVFRDGSDALAEFRRDGEPAKHVIRPVAGPLGMTVKGPDAETLDAYLRLVQR